MKTTIALIGTIAGITTALPKFVEAQAPDWNTAGNAGTNAANDFVGTTDSKPVNFRTSNVVRSRLYEGNAVTINGFAGINQAGYWGLGRNAAFFTGVGAFSRLHIADFTNSTWQGGFRPNDVNGIPLRRSAVRISDDAECPSTLRPPAARPFIVNEGKALGKHPSAGVEDAMDPRLNRLHKSS